VHFPDGGKAVLGPGMVATITGGSFYQLENTGSGPMILMGNRSGPSEAIQHINHASEKTSKSSAEMNWSVLKFLMSRCKQGLE